jgi:flavorubredoxin
MAFAPRRAHGCGMNTRIDPIAKHVHRISTHVPEGPPGGITFNQFLILGDEPLLFHTGTPRLFPAIRSAVATLVDPKTLRWIASGHVSRPDEYGSVNEWLALAPRAQVAHGKVGCFVCLSDVTVRPPRPLNDGETMDLGGTRVKWLDTPHVPGPWEAGVLFEQESATLFCGDLFSRSGRVEVTSTVDIVADAIGHDERMHGTAITPATGPTLRRLASLKPKTLALMHGPAFQGDGAAPLRALADYYDGALRRLCSAPGSPALC